LLAAGVKAEIILGDEISGGAMKKQPLIAISVLLLSVGLFAAPRAFACPAGSHSVLGLCLPDLGAAIGRAFNHFTVAPRNAGSSSPAPVRPLAPSVAPGPQHTRAAVLDTGYQALTKPGGEEAGYGLYSYVIAPGHTTRNAELLRTIMKQVAPVENTGHDKSEINVLYIPVKPAEQKAFDKLKTAVFSDSADGFDADVLSLYDQAMALELLHRICSAAAGDIEKLCLSDTSQGPFLFTYARPVTDLQNVPPPYLIVDLRPVHERAFPVFVSKFMEQVKRPDFADGERIHSFQLSLLSIILKAADWIEPVQNAVAGIVHSTGDQTKDEK
jgi:hypothetical protein